MTDNLWMKTSKHLKEINKCIREDLAETSVSHLSVSAVYTLAALYGHDGQRPVDLANTIGYPSTAFTPVLDRLELHDLIYRKVNKADRRSVLIYLTDNGYAVQRVIKKALKNAEVRYGGG